MKPSHPAPDLVTAYLLAQAGLSLPVSGDPFAMQTRPAPQPAAQPGVLPVRWH